MATHWADGMAKKRIREPSSTAGAEMSPYERFKNAAESWSAEQFEVWLSDGAATLADRIGRLDRLRAFDFILLDPQLPPEDQIGAALRELPERGYINSRRAVENIVGHLPHQVSRIYIDFFFRLAGSLRPKGFARIVRDWLQRPLISERIGDWQKTIRTAIVAASEFPYSEEFEDLTSFVRQTSAWRPIFARYAILARVRSGSSGWPQVLGEYERDLEELRRNDPIEFQTFLLLLVATIKLAGIAAELPIIVAGELQHLSWIANELVRREGAPLNVPLDLHNILLAHGETSVILNYKPPILEQHELPGWKSFLNRKASRPERDHVAAKSKALERANAMVAAAGWNRW